MHAVTRRPRTLIKDDINALHEDEMHATGALVLLPAIQLLRQPGRPFRDEAFGCLECNAPSPLRTAVLCGWWNVG